MGAGLGAVVFRYMIEGLTRLFTGYLDYAGHGHVGNPHLLGARPLVRAAHPGRRRHSVRAAGLPLRPRGARSRRARGDGRGRPQRRPHPPAGRRGQGDRIRAVHRRRRIGRARGTDRADRLRAGLDARSAGQARRAPDQAAGRLRRGRRDRGHLQRPAGRGVLRDGTHPAPVGGRVVRDGRAVLGHRQRDRALDPGQPPVPDAADVSRSTMSCSTRCSRSSVWSPAWSGSCSPGCCMRSRTPATGPGAGRNGCAPRPAGCCSVDCCWCCPRCTASATPSSAAPSPAVTASRS